MKNASLIDRVNPYESPQFDSEENDNRPFFERHPCLNRAIIGTEILMTGAGLIGINLAYNYLFKY